MMSDDDIKSAIKILRKINKLIEEMPNSMEKSMQISNKEFLMNSLASRVPLSKLLNMVLFDGAVLTDADEDFKEFDDDP